MDDPPDTGRRPAAEPGNGRARYDRDLQSWAVEQAELLRAGRVAEADVLNILERGIAWSSKS